MSLSTNSRIAFVFNAKGVEGVMFFTRDQHERHLFMLAVDLVKDEIQEVSNKITSYLKSVQNDASVDLSQRNPTPLG